MKAVIVAAGQGTRLWPLTRRCPKPLIPLLGKPIIGYVLDALCKAGVKEVIVVIGYLGRMFKERLSRRPREGVRIHYVWNYDYTKGNGISVRAAERVVEDDDFLLLMADHIIEPKIIESLISTDREFSLCVDRTPRFPPQIKDATKVLISEDGYIKRIGKNLSKWNGVDTGVFLCEPVIFKAANAVANLKHRVTISDCMRWLIKHQHRVRAHDISNAFWLDIDTPDDLRFAEELMNK
ncbi:MAG: sugar phosphate nucleotidyltransferase [Candidatus Bathyarchaeia archaeon]